MSPSIEPTYFSAIETSTYGAKLVALRIAVEAVIEFTGATPKREDVKQMLGSKYGVDAPLIAIRKIANEFGDLRAKVTAHLYANADNFKRLETTSKKTKLIKI